RARISSGDRDGLPAPRDIVFEFLLELLDSGHDWGGAGIRQHTDRLTGHVVGEVEQQIQVGRLPLPRQDPLENLRGPRGSFATLRALGARLVRVEPGQSHDLVDHVGRIVEHDHAAGPEHRAFLDYALVVEETAVGLLDYEGVVEKGSMLGSGGVIVFDDSTDMVYQIMRLARFYAHESCAQCTQCREGTAWTTKILERILSGQGKTADLDLLLDLAENMTGKTICVLSDSCAAPVVSGIKKFKQEFEDYIAGRRKPLLVA